MGAGVGDRGASACASDSGKFNAQPTAIRDSNFDFIAKR
jgi:hypothetical protein